MAKRKTTSRLVGPVILALAVLALLIAGLMRGKDIVLFNPKGLIAGEQARLMISVTAVMLALAIPTLFLLYFFAWRYRETNQKAKRTTKGQGKFSAFTLWVIPSVVLVILASIMLPATHKLDPHKSIASDAKPLTIQVIALRWKWLFIYPEQDIATVNYVQIPTDVPVQFELTADEAPMNSFWIPHLGGQLYAMTGHSNQLNLMADTTGDYIGQAAEINGEGFADMKFTTHAGSQAEFDQWVHDVSGSSNKLNAAEYQKLLVPSEKNSVMLYASPKPDLYATVLAKYSSSHDHHGGTQ